MRYPLTLSAHQTIILAKTDFFDKIGRFAPEEQILEVNLSWRGPNTYRWFLDADGQFYALTWQKLLPPTLLNRLKLTKQREQYSLIGPATISPTKLLELLQDHTDEIPELPHVADLRSQLMTCADANAPLDRTFMQAYLAD